MSGASLPRLFRAAWPSLPALLAGSVAVCAGAAATALTGPGLTPISVAAAAVLIGAPLAALVHLAVRMWHGEEPTVRDWLGCLRSAPARGVAVTAVPAGIAALTLVSLEVWAQSRQAWVLVPLALGGALTVVTGLGACVALPLALHRPELRGAPLWAGALHLVARNPVRVLAVPAVAVLAAQAATGLTASLLLLFPAPLALVMVAAAFTSTTSAQPTMGRTTR
ncbi:hypothetical protein ABGB14_29355 [Nonomuraea sp. B10E15]|uniref:hypothetical protein n=1 Tax=unclassified Nonomuraea TaxID=2593643 RepID=UPI00325DE4CC